MKTSSACDGILSRYSTQWRIRQSASKPPSLRCPKEEGLMQSIPVAVAALNFPAAATTSGTRGWGGQSSKRSGGSTSSKSSGPSSP
eukprot:4416671-Pyramimonas_sp.AAC.1